MKRFRVLPSTLILVLSFGLSLGQIVPASAQTTPTLGIFSTDYFSPDIVDPLLTPGSIFTIDVTIADAPPIVNDTYGGINGFDIFIHYNPSILKATDADWESPLCPSAEGCLWDGLSVLTFARSIDFPPGTTRIAIAGIGSANRIQGSGIMFRILFQVIGTGSTAVTVSDQQPDQTQITEPQGPGNIVAIPYTTLNGSFDNNPPFIMSTFPASGSVNASRNIGTTVTVEMFSGGSQNVSLSVIGLPAGATALFTPLSGFTTFTSDLNITTTTATPPGTYPLTINGFCELCAGGLGYSSQTTYTLTVNVPDAHVTSLTLFPNSVFVGQTVNATVSVKNEGTVPSRFTVNLSANTTIVASKLAGILSTGSSENVTLQWNTTSFTPGIYIVSATVPNLMDEFDLADNTASGGAVTVVRANVPPSPIFVSDKTSPAAGEETTFDASSSSDADGTITSYSWTFGDGSPSETGRSVTHKFQSAGNYTVTLTVTDNDGATQAYSRTVTVVATGGLFTSTLALAGIAAALILLVLGLALYSRSRRKGKAVKSNPEKPQKEA